MSAKFVIMLTKYGKYREGQVLEIVDMGVDWVRVRQSGVIIFKDFVKIVSS